MPRAVYCEFCDYELVGLIEDGGTAVCPECGKTVQGRWFPRRVRVGLAVFASVLPMLMGVVVICVADVLRAFKGGGSSLFEVAVVVNGLAGVLLPPAAAWWLWTKSARRRLDFIDIACLVPVGWLLNGLIVFAAAMILL